MQTPIKTLRKLALSVSFVVLAMFVVVGIITGYGTLAAAQDSVPRVVGGFGLAKVQGEDVIVHVLVEVPKGIRAQEAVKQALERYGARPFADTHLGSEGFKVIGRWATTLAVQNYNPNSQPVLAKDSLLNTHNTWNSVATSGFTFIYGSDTTRCPSLVRDCPGPQYLDGYNDVAWLGLRGGVLGVAWIASQDGYIVEVDIALSTRFSWSTDGVNDYDVETVFLHENGHFPGLGHSSYPAAVMYAYYNDVQRVLHWDDEEGITYLYDNDVTGVVSGSVKDSSGNPIGGATVVLVDTGLSAVSASDGSYTISNVPDPVAYDARASKDGYTSETKREKVDGATTVDFVLAESGEGGGNGEICPPGKSRKGQC